VAGGTRLTLIGHSLVLESGSFDGVTESSANSNQSTVVSSVRVGNYTAIVDRESRFDLTHNNVMEIVGMHFAL
jgi:hypothetical protein